MKNRLRVIRIKKFFRKRIIPISILAGVALSIVNICCLSVLYGSISTMINISGEGEVEKAEESNLTLSLSDYSQVKITPTGYSLSGDSEISYTGPYIITGSQTSDTPLIICNNASSGGYNGAVFNIKLVDATITGGVWCTATVIEGDCSSVVNMEIEGTCLSKGYNHPGISSRNYENVLNLNVLSGSLTFSAATISGFPTNINSSNTALNGFASVTFNGENLTLTDSGYSGPATFNANGTIS